MKQAALNLSSLRDEISWDDISAYVNSMPGSKWIKFNRRMLFTIAMVFLCIAILLIIIDIVSVGSGNYAVSGVACFFVTIVSLVFISQGKQRYTREVRLARFAKDNDLSYTAHQRYYTRKGMIFGIGRDHNASGILRSGPSSPVQFEIAHYSYTVGYGKRKQIMNWRYVSVEMDRSLPNIVLDAKKNNLQAFGKNILSNLPVSFKNNQKLSLEGDFDSHFSLYVPVGYERDALYIFTPDLMALLIDGAHDFDAEIVDKTVFFYQKINYFDAVRGPAPEYYEKIGKIINDIGSKMDRQTDYYMDQRIDDRAMNVIAPEGRRLKKGVSIATVIAIIYVIINLISVFSRGQ